MTLRENWPAGVAARIDSANAAYRAGDYAEARRLFRDATEQSDRVPTAWFGVYMAEHALGNVAAADSALKRAQSLGGSGEAPAAGSPHRSP